MSLVTTKSFLRLVSSDSWGKELIYEDLMYKTTGHQGELFASPNPTLLIFADISNISESDILKLFYYADPRVVIDLRDVPRFDIGNLNRRSVFQLFKKHKSKYLDIHGIADDENIDLCCEPSTLQKIVRKQLTEDEQKKGPILFLLDKSQRTSGCFDTLRSILPSPSPKNDWDIYTLP
ncbi:MAG: hypothetical protein ACC651_14660 [Candidatus Scalindua sp.]